MTLSEFGGLGRNLQSKLQRFFEAALDENATPIELVQAVLDDVENHVQPLGRGRRCFPYTRVTVTMREPKAGTAAVEAAFENLEQRLRERLTEVRCEPPAAIEVNVCVVDSAPEGWSATQMFRVAYQKAGSTVDAIAGSGARLDAATEPLAAEPLELVVVKGAASEERFPITGASIAIGRTAEPTDGIGRFRRNGVAFLDAVDGVTETVGRAHARLRYEAATGAYLLFDEGSANGTSIVRDGTTIPVLPRDPRGVRIRRGDELRLGRAVIRVE